MFSSPQRKTKVNLPDYNFQLDLENRLLMAHFTLSDVEVLEEVLNNSLTIPISQLNELLELPEEKIYQSLMVLAETKLLRIEKDTIIVDKEMRKYYESQIDKFDDNFRPTMHFLQALLRKVPIQVLPSWYAIPKTSDNIFQSIVDKHLLTPKIFYRYFNEFPFEEEGIIKGIVEDVYNAPNQKLRSRDLRQKYDLTREEFEKQMLQLEYNFFCCLSYNQVGEEWKEVVTPFQEWRDYLSQTKHATPPILPEDEVTPDRKISSSFTKDLTKILENIKHSPIQWSRGEKLPKDKIEEWKSLCEEMEETSETFIQIHFSRILAKLQEMHLTKVEEEGTLCASPASTSWFEMSSEDQGIFLYRNPKNQRFSQNFPEELYSDINYRKVEEAIDCIDHDKWILFDNFLEGMNVTIGKSEGTHLHKKAGCWGYHKPAYSDTEQAFIKAVIFERIYQAGFVATGTFEGKACFRLTDLGLSIWGKQK